MSARGAVARQCAGAVLALAWAFAACADGDRKPVEQVDAGGSEGSGATSGASGASGASEGSGATSGASEGSGAASESGGTGGTEPGELQVEFEELLFEGEPAFLTDFVFYPG